MTLDEAREALRPSNSYSRLPALIDLAWSLEWGDWITLLGEEWTVCDNVGLYTEELLDCTPFGELIDLGGPCRALMTSEEQAAYDALPDEVTIHRGCYASNKWGLSWSLDRAVAARFPGIARYRQAGQALLVEARIAKGKVLAVKLCRKEAEIIALRPKHVSTSHLKLTGA